MYASSHTGVTGRMGLHWQYFPGGKVADGALTFEQQNSHSGSTIIGLTVREVTSLRDFLIEILENPRLDYDQRHPEGWLDQPYSDGDGDQVDGVAGP